RAIPASAVPSEAPDGAANAAEAIDQLRAIYSSGIGYDFDHVQIAEERAWLRHAVETGAYDVRLDPDEQRRLLQRLTDVESFEKFLHQTYLGQKRFSIEGTDTLVPILDEIVRDASSDGIGEIVLGMAHRGRLNVMAHVLNKPYAAILAGFEGNKGKAVGNVSDGGVTGDVKYHLGAKLAETSDGRLVEVPIVLAPNPSHLEFVDPVVEGMVRATQDDRTHAGPPPHDAMRSLAILLHGDAAFPGQGIVAETLNLSGLPGYATGGTIHIIVNNQIGFTTDVRDSRSTLYAGDLAKGFEIPVVHVNADDVVACLSVARLAIAYRLRFGKDFLIDLVGYRRWGHNEGDEPSFTQPAMYALITQHPTVRQLWADRLVAAGVVPADEPAKLLQAALDRLAAIRRSLSDSAPTSPAPSESAPQPRREVETAVPLATLREYHDAIHAFGEGFTPNAKLARQWERRRTVLDQPDGKVDWAHAEALAFAAILSDGMPIRLTGQDAERGTFSQRHLVLHDGGSGVTWTPLEHLPSARASFAVYNSPLSEAAAVGFEYGYSVHAPEAFVLWEAQFGDFANGAQVFFDQFIAAARAKWQQEPALALLLPHGYEGQGPEHSSGRLERFLQLSAEGNLRVANCTTAAQYFHLLRRQALLLGPDRHPLVVMTPKSLLRNPLAASTLEQLATGTFQPVLDDPLRTNEPNNVTRLVLCSGKIGVELDASEVRAAAESVAVARVEQLAPFQNSALRALFDHYPNLDEVVWAQEEPKNMGAWSYMEPRLRDLLGQLERRLPIRYVGRPERASPAEGYADRHAAEQARIVAEAFGAVGETMLAGAAGALVATAANGAKAANGAQPDGHRGPGGNGTKAAPTTRAKTRASGR
ncbi:MAG TPA: 2-oxoglutarate dehydrogenase E1 component, partial [Thermomicrobiales bacterium]|nr:2-oxoglutarate dehydrogenase E1 component [Thermomicrobiales bacterium]